MKKTFFKDIIEYNKNQIIFYDEDFTLNLASLLFSNYATNIDSTKGHATVKKIFNLFNVIKVNNLVKQYFDGKNYIVFVQPDFEYLIHFFGYNLPKMETEIESIAERTKSLYDTECQNALYDIESFIEIRNFPKKLIREISPYREEYDEELLDLIRNLNICFSKASLKANDFFCEKTSKGQYLLIKQNKEIKVNTFHNYKSLRYFCTRTALSENEYHNYHHMKKQIIGKKEYEEANLKMYPHSSESKRLIMEYENMLDMINEIIDKINDNKFYNRETFALLSLKLEILEKQEEALDEFIHKILNNELKTVEVECFDDKIPSRKIENQTLTTNDKLRNCIKNLIETDKNKFEEYPELGVDWLNFDKYGFILKDDDNE